MREVGSMKPAGLPVRLLAFALDYLVILAYLVPLVGLGVVASRFAPSLSGSLFSGPLRGQALGFLLVTLPVASYFAVSESSASRATWGKKRMHLVVTTAAGNRLGLARSFLRTGVKFIPWELAHLFVWQITFASDPSRPVYTAGFVAVWILVFADIAAMYGGGNRQMLHDRAARTVVVSDAASST